MKFQFFKVQEHKKISDSELRTSLSKLYKDKNIENISSVFNNNLDKSYAPNFDNYNKNNINFLQDCIVISMQCVNKQIFLLCKRQLKVKEKDKLQENLKAINNNNNNNRKSVLEYVILKIYNNTIIDEYNIFNRTVYTFNICKKESLYYNPEQTNTAESLKNYSFVNDNYLFIVSGSDFVENKSTNENKIEFNVLSAIYIISANKLVDLNNNFKSDFGDINNLIIKKINLVTIKNSNFLYTDKYLPKSYNSIDNINCLAYNNEINMISLGLESGNIVLVYPNEFPLNYNPSKYNFDTKDNNNNNNSTIIKNNDIKKNNSILSTTSFNLNNTNNQKLIGFSSMIDTKSISKQVHYLPLKSPLLKDISVIYEKLSLIDYKLLNEELETIKFNTEPTKSVKAIILTDTSESGLPITSVEFSILKSRKTEYCLIYVCTFNKIMCYSIDKKIFKLYFQTINASVGCYPNGLIKDYRLSQILVCTHNNYICEYINFEKGATWMFNGKIQCITKQKNNIAFILYESATPILCVYDLKNKHFSYYNTNFYKINLITLDLNDMSFIVLIENKNNQRQFISLHERENIYKFNYFYKRNLYELAFDYARNLKYSKKQISEIHLNYGDYLYNQNELQKAVDEYIKTISYIHPSFIIAKFLDNTKIEFLIMYLEALHYNSDFKLKIGSSITNFTKLLLSIYTKQKKFKKLEVFIENLNFVNYNITTNDVEELIEVCQSLDQINIALVLAKKTLNYNKVIDIYVNDKSKLFYYVLYIIYYI